MRGHHACGYVAILFSPILLIGCSPQPEPATQPERVETPPPIVELKEAQPVTLRTALRAPDERQPVRIQLRERRVSSGQGMPETVHELDLDLSASLEPDPDEPGRPSRRLLVFQHLGLTLSMQGQTETRLSYDSRTDEPGTGNPLADLMSCVKDARLKLEIGPSGRLRNLTGLDPRWGQAGMVLAPPALIAAQWYFRDMAMQELLAEALFPPMPASPVRPGDRWEIDMPANIPLVARLNSRLSHELTEDELTMPGPVTDYTTIRALGVITPAGEILPNERPGMTAVVQDASHHVLMRVAPETHQLSLTSKRHIKALVRLTPPTGTEQLAMTVQQQRTLTAQRGHDLPGHQP